MGRATGTDCLPAALTWQLPIPHHSWCHLNQQRPSLLTHPPHLVQQALHAAAQHRGQQVHLGQQAAQARLSGVPRQPRLGRQLRDYEGEAREVGAVFNSD